MEGYIGEIRLFAGDFEPKYWAFCKGQTLAIAQNQALFSILGNTYGGNGVTTFALPDLQGRIPVGPGQFLSLGGTVGNETTVLTAQHLPAHTHTASGTVSFGGRTGRGTLSSDPTNNYFSAVGADVKIFKDSADKTMGKSPVDVTVNNTGGNAPVNNMAPFQCLNYIICLSGIYPSRN